MMKRFSIAAAALLAVVFSVSTFAQPAQTLPIPDGPVARDVPGAKELPDPNMTYKVVFDLASAAPKVEEVNPGLTMVVRYLNTLAKYCVPADHRKIAVVFHRGATNVILNNETFKERTGHDNPN